jgi:hypothetical protein
LNAIWVGNQGDAVAVGDNGIFLQRTAGGHWKQIPATTKSNLRGVWGADPGHLQAVGDGGIAVAFDGHELKLQDTRTQADLRGLHGAMTNDVWAVGADCTVRRFNDHWHDGPIDAADEKERPKWYSAMVPTKVEPCVAEFTAVWRPTVDMTKVKEFIPRLAAKLEKSPMISRVDYKKPLRFFWDRALYFSSVDDLQHMRDGIKDAFERETAKGTGLYIDFEEDDNSPDAKSGTLQKLFGKYQSQLNSFGTSEWYIHPDGTSIGLVVFPVKAMSDLGNLRRLKVEIERSVANSGYQQIDPLLRVDVGGDGANKILEYDATIYDIFGTLWIPILGVIVLILVYFRRIQGLFLAMIPLGMSICWTAALTQLLVGTLNFITGFLFAVLTGLGIDYGIQLFGRYREGRSAGLSPEESMDHVILDTGRATLTSSLTTSVALLTMTVTDFRGFSEFGFIAGIGILLALLSFILVLPSMIFLAEKLRILRLPVVPAKASTEGNAQGQEPFRLPRLVLVVSALVTIYGIYGATQLSFEHDTRKLRSVRKGDEIEKRSGHTYGQSFTPTLMVTDSRDQLESALNALKRRSQSFGAKSSVREVVSILHLIPERQHEKQVVLNELNDLFQDQRWNLVSDETKERIDLDRLRQMVKAKPFELTDLPKEVRRAFKGPGFGDVWLGLVFYRIDVGNTKSARLLKDEVGSFAGAPWVNLGNIVPASSTIFAEGQRAEIRCPPTQPTCSAQVIKQLQNLTYQGRPVFSQVVERNEAYKQNLAVPDGLRGDILAIAHSDFITRNTRGPAAVQESGTYHVSSGELVLVEVVEVMLHDGRIALLLAFFAVFVTCLLDFRSLRFTILAFLPLLLGFIWTFGIMKLIHLKLNMFNFVILPALLGIGIDYGVHYVHRYREEGEGNLARVMRSLYLVIFFCAATTLVGFGNVTFAANPGLKSLGNLAIIGVACIFFAATYTLPSVLYVVERLRGVKLSAPVIPSLKEPAVMVYAMSYCPSCRMVRRFLSDHEVSYTCIEVDTLPPQERQALAAHLVKISGIDTLPVTQKGDKCVIGFTPQALKDLISYPARKG